MERDPLRFRYRLVGTRIVEYNDQEFTGRYLGEIGWLEEHELWDELRRGGESPAAAFRLLHLGLRTGRRRTLRVRHVPADQ